MAQGQVLSVLARALQLRPDERVAEAGELAFRNLMTPVPEGGAFSTMADLDSSLSDFLFFPEYPSDPIDYTLNGYIFCLLGIYDWSKTDSRSHLEAEEVFNKGVQTTERIVHYFDVDGFSTYDLGHIVLGNWPYVSEHYLGIHVYLLHALHSITNVERFKEYEIKWADKIDQMNRPLRLTTFVIEPDLLKAGEPVTIQVGVSGGSEKPAEFRLAVKQGNDWTDISAFSTATNIKWTPKESGEFIVGIFSRNVGSQTDYDNFRYQSVTVE